VWTNAYDPGTETRTPKVLHLGFDGEVLDPDIQRAVPFFSPDGRHHAFKSTGDDGNYGVHMYAMETGEYRFVAPVYESDAFLGHRAGKNLVWSPDGRYIAYVSAEHEPAEPSETEPMVLSRLLFKSRTGYSDNLRTHIFITAVDGGEPRQLTTGEYDEHSIAWSPDGTEIAFISNRALDPDDVHGNDLWVVNVDDGSVRQLTDTPGPEFGPDYSPDGRWIAFTAGVRPMNTRDSPMENDQLWVMPSEGGAQRSLTTALDRRVKGFQWSGDSRSLFFRADNEGSVHLYHVPVTGGPVDAVITEEGEITHFIVSPTQDRIAYRMVGRRRAPEIYATSFDGSWKKQLTHLQGPFYENVSFSAAEPFWFESFDGTRVQGWLAKPNPFESGQTYPVVMMIHGGPHGAYRHNIDFITQALAEAGYGVLRINPRGSVGYGQEFADGTLNDWGGGDYQDLMAGVDHAVDHVEWVDGDRLGLWGYSYGGYMTNWIVTQTDRFRAAVSGGSLSNLISFYGTSLYHLLVETEFPGEVWENYDILWDRSPLKHVANVETPTLLVHGEVDHDVPVTQAEEMFVALKKLGVDTEFVRYPGMGHGFNSGAAMDDYFRRMMEWYDRYLKEGT